MFTSFFRAKAHHENVCIAVTDFMELVLTVTVYMCKTERV